MRTTPPSDRSVVAGCRLAAQLSRFSNGRVPAAGLQSAAGLGCRLNSGGARIFVNIFGVFLTVFGPKISHKITKIRHFSCCFHGQIVWWKIHRAQCACVCVLVSVFSVRLNPVEFFFNSKSLARGGFEFFSNCARIYLDFTWIWRVLPTIRWMLRLISLSSK